ncbi:hypothetical protein [Nonomuraea sp. NPDC049625]|uniref:hypothetical protein n=1 Tax=Nonomuraea sp. NPDC049625 TaxID=3155775 RepID=UPI003418A0EA
MLLVLSPNPLPDGEDGSAAMESLTDMMASAGCGELHMLHIEEFKTSSFLWPLLLEFRLPPEADEQVRSQRVGGLRKYIMEHCGWLASGSPRFLWLRQTGFGVEHDGADLIVSLYSWQESTSAPERERHMWDHFDLERQESDYTAVHFNVSTGQEHFDNGEFDFVFQAYVDDPEGLSRIYASPRLEMMREHSRRFLDTDTRRLGFGRVRIVNLS